ncbi:MAG: hypothetical protein AABP62_11895 [Planctomycetota bacterium]
MTTTTKIPKLLPRREADRRMDQVLAEIQRELMPDHALDVVAINLETGEYERGRDDLDAALKFRARWPGQMSYLVRVDGGPVAKFYGI